MTIDEIVKLLQLTNDLARSLDELDGVARDLDSLQEQLDVLLGEAGDA